MNDDNDGCVRFTGYLVRFCPDSPPSPPKSGGGGFDDDDTTEYCRTHSSVDCPNHYRGGHNIYYVDRVRDAPRIIQSIRSKRPPIVVGHNDNALNEVGYVESVKLLQDQGVLIEGIIDDEVLLNAIQNQHRAYRQQYTENISYSEYLKNVFSSISLSHNPQTGDVKHIGLVNIPGRPGTAVSYSKESSKSRVLRRPSASSSAVFNPNDLLTAHVVAFSRRSDRPDLLKHNSRFSYDNTTNYITASVNYLNDDYEQQKHHHHHRKEEDPILVLLQQQLLSLAAAAPETTTMANNTGSNIQSMSNLFMQVANALKEREQRQQQPVQQQQVQQLLPTQQLVPQQQQVLQSSPTAPSTSVGHQQLIPEQQQVQPVAQQIVPQNQVQSVGQQVVPQQHHQEGGQQQQQQLQQLVHTTTTSTNQQPTVSRKRKIDQHVENGGGQQPPPQKQVVHEEEEKEKSSFDDRMNQFKQQMDAMQKLLSDQTSRFRAEQERQHLVPAMLAPPHPYNLPSTAATSSAAQQLLTPWKVQQQLQPQTVQASYDYGNNGGGVVDPDTDSLVKHLVSLIDFNATQNN